LPLTKTEFRCELLSADQLAALASGPLPSGVAADESRRSLHRDLYLDTPEGSLRRRGIVCRMRVGADGRSSMSLRIAGSNGTPPTRVSAMTRSSEVAEAIASGNAVVHRLRGIVDPSLLQVQLDLQVDRLTRPVARDWLRRPRVAVHLDRVSVSRGGRDGAVGGASFFQMCAHRLRGDGTELEALERALEEEHGLRPSTVATHERAELAVKWARLEDVPRGAGYSDSVLRASIERDADSAPEFINPEISLLAFQHRVLSLAEDPTTPVRERLRFLSIVSANVDEFFMVRLARLSAFGGAPEEPSDDGLTPAEQLAAITESVAAIALRKSRCVRECYEVLAERGIHVCSWLELSETQRETLRGRFRSEIQPLLTPFAMTLSPGHPLPRLSHLSLSLAMVLRNRAGGPPRFAELELPASVPRFFDVSEGGEHVFVALEDVVRGNLDAIYPADVGVEQSYVFRVTRIAELALDEANADDLLDEVERATATRGQGVVVRLEVDRGMPPVLRALLLEDVRREHIGTEAPCLVTDVEEVDGLVDLRGLTELELPVDPTASYPRLELRRPFSESELSGSAFDVIAAGDMLVHHPFDSFADTVVRFLHDAARDPAVAAIKITLYRVGNPSPIADALLEAARQGKAVTVFVELKARFDEEINVGWARALEAAGGHVVRGLVGFKNHAKVALVVRRESAGLRRYVHIGTGNYNARSGEQYTDLSFFTTDDAITSDVSDLFNELTGMSEPPRRKSRALLVAPHHLLPSILERIDREAAHARAGREARITAKLNGMSDPDVVRALYRASRDGVEIDLVVRGICTLRPGIPGRSERIRVESVVGRFLEHSRIYRFANGGDPRYFIGSADLRPRNLRRRVELIVPIANAQHRRLLDDILRLYTADPTAWDLQPDGSYVARPGGIPAQSRLGMATARKA
jgi:polyphosphate kinase